MRFCNCGNPVFGTDKKTGIGYCKSCQWKRTDTDKRSIIQKAIAKNASKNETSKVRKLLTDNVNMEMINKKKELDTFFEERMGNNYPKCENCGAEKIILLDARYKKQWKSCQAHLLPKRHFGSIKTHPLNIMVLGSGYSGMCHCHDDYDHDWGRASKMKIWGEVVRRFKLLYPLIPESEQRHIPEVLLKELKQ